MSTKETDNKKLNSNEELITREEMPNSPFVVIGTKGVYFGTMGKYRITEERETQREVIEELEEITWNRIIQVIMLLTDLNKEKNED